MNITQEIDLPNGEMLTVEFSAECHMENDGIGPYEYWGAKCFDAGTDYAQLDSDIEWDKTKYTDEQNKAIENQPKEFWDNMEERFCIQYEENQAEEAFDRQIDRAEYLRDQAKERQMEAWYEKNKF